ncbi:LytS/YhcK type 5TM receptor domain-containing protein [Sporomusa malonica]|uniref:histidine kinase n=1 Tax=Sporomusa malonica TaxID=112901 RepID=A0A1W2BB90_9FIRM|nr:LytS/YhcK type 5TM receptor domain-containing protein [Sporomusa malonica]SMC69972.1 two-component system, LytT family, sensor histidine kinase LytS [Sporomusa malonica]
MDFLNLDIVLNLLGDMALIALVAYLLGRSRFIASCVNLPMNIRHWFVLTVIFSILSILGTYNGIPIEGAWANTRLIGTLMSGIMGGPIVGFSVGLISGFHRYLLGGFTAETCGVATALGGLFAGIMRQKIGLNNMTWKTAGAIALVAELIQKVMVLVFAKPFEAAWAMEKIIAIPTTLVSVLGTVAFMLIIKDIQSQQEAHAAKAAELSLRTASKTLPYLRHGLNSRSATETANIIYELTKVDAVSITDREKILAYIGKGSDHHRAGEPILTQSTKRAVAEGTLAVIHTHEERGCPVPDCPLHSGVVAPLIAQGVVVGTIKLSRMQAGGVNEMDIQLARGIAELLSVQIELAEIDAQKKMREKAELKALRAQINPHFLFNTITIIMSLCRTSPETARNLLEHLAIIMKYSFAKHDDFVTIEEELEKVQSYLEIAKSRFGSRLAVTFDIEAAVLKTRIPVLSVQPLVENAIQHGLFPKLSAGQLVIKACREEDFVQISVFDNGVGIEPAIIRQLFSADTEGIGVQNVHQRLKGIYGDAYGLRLESQPGSGTWAIIRIPYTREVEVYENESHCS